MKYPAEVYTPAPRPYRGIGRVEYPMHDRTVTVTSCGRICMKGKKINLSTVFAGQDVGIKEVKGKIWLVSFMEYDLGYFDEDSRKVRTFAEPFWCKSVTYVFGINCHLCVRNGPSKVWWAQ